MVGAGKIGLALKVICYTTVKRSSLTVLPQLPIWFDQVIFMCLNRSVT